MMRTMPVLIVVTLVAASAGADQDVYFTNPIASGPPETAGRIQTIASDGAITEVVPGLDYPSALCFDPIGTMYFADPFSGDVTQRAPDGTLTYIGDFKQNWPGGGFRIGWDIDVVANDAGQLFFNIPQHTGTSTPGSISVMDVSTGVLTELVGGLEYPSAISLDSSGNLYFADRWSGVLTQRMPGGTLTDIGNVWDDYAGGGISISWDLDIVAADDGNVYFTQPTGNADGNVSVMAPDGTVSILIDNLDNPTGLAMDDDGNVYAVEKTSGAVTKRGPDGTLSVYGSVWDSWPGGGKRIGWDLDIAVAPGSNGPKIGDFDGDNDVDADDIDILCDNMGGSPCEGDICLDLDGDGDIDEDDMIFIMDYVEWDRDRDGTVDGVGTKRGDINLDGLVNATDLASMNPNFGLSGMGYADANLNCDDIINATDLAILADNFGYIAPMGAVPEPVTFGLLSLGAVALLRRRK